jgi:hypothetical protein
MRVPDHSLLIIVNDNDTISVEQFTDSTQCKIAYTQAIAEGKDAYFYFIPVKKKATTPSAPPIKVIL